MPSTARFARIGISRLALGRAGLAAAAMAATIATSAACGGKSGHNAAAPAAAPRSSTAVAPAPTSLPTAGPTVPNAVPPTSASSITAKAPATPAKSKPAAPHAVPAPVPPASLPNAAAAAWQPVGSLTQMQLSPTRAVALGECANVTDVAAWHEQGYISAQNSPAQEDIFTFPDPAAADAAYQQITVGMTGCQQTVRALQQTNHVPADAQVTATANTPDGRAWSRTWTGVAGASAAGPQINHYYLVHRGTTVILAEVTEFGTPAHPYDTAGDPAIVTMLAAHTD